MMAAHAKPVVFIHSPAIVSNDILICNDLDIVKLYHAQISPLHHLIEYCGLTAKNNFFKDLCLSKQLHGTEQFSVLQNLVGFSSRGTHKMAPVPVLVVQN